MERLLAQVSLIGSATAVEHATEAVESLRWIDGYVPIGLGTMGEVRALHGRSQRASAEYRRQVRLELRIDEPGAGSLF
jgi:hypothetical protein